jgi:integrase
MIAAGTVYQAIALLKAHFKAAHNAGEIPKNPAAGIRQLKLSNARREIYTPDQLSAIHGPLKDAPFLTREYFPMLLSLAVRPSELRKAKFSAVDEVGCTLYLGDTKSGRPMLVPMPPAAMASYWRLKAQRREGNDHLFPAVRGDGPMSPPRKAFKKVLDAAGIKNRTFHDARRTAASIAVNQPGISVFDISRALNHSSIRVTEARYLVTGDARIRQALTASSAVLHAQLNPESPSVSAPSVVDQCVGQ